MGRFLVWFPLKPFRVFSFWLSWLSIWKQVVPRFIWLFPLGFPLGSSTFPSLHVSGKTWGWCRAGPPGDRCQLSSHPFPFWAGRGVASQNGLREKGLGANLFEALWRTWAEGGSPCGVGKPFCGFKGKPRRAPPFRGSGVCFFGPQIGFGSSRLISVQNQEKGASTLSFGKRRASLTHFP